MDVGNPAAARVEHLDLADELTRADSERATRALDPRFVAALLLA